MLEGDFADRDKQYQTAEASIVFVYFISHSIQLIPQELSAGRKNPPAPQAPASGQKTEGCIKGERPGRRRYQEFFLSFSFSLT